MITDALAGGCWFARADARRALGLAGASSNPGRLAPRNRARGNKDTQP
jgi:hypothetical protein